MVILHRFYATSFLLFKILKTTEAETLIYFYIKSISAIIVIL